MYVQLEEPRGAKWRHTPCIHLKEEKIILPLNYVQGSGREKKDNGNTLARQEKLVSSKKVFNCMEDDIDPDQVEFGSKSRKLREVVYTQITTKCMCKW